MPGVILTPRFARRYTYDRIGAHVLGHVDTDLRGTAGLELQYDDVLRGHAGRQAVQRDRRGFIKALVGGSVVEPEHGQQLVLTLDLVLQSILQEELVRGVEEADATWGTAIAMDPKTGAVLAMANVPDYDPNRASAFSEAARRNHAITDQVEPGSTFKLVTAVAALESGIVTPEDSIETGAGLGRLRRADDAATPTPTARSPSPRRLRSRATSPSPRPGSSSTPAPSISTRATSASASRRGSTCRARRAARSASPIGGAARRRPR